MIIVCAGPRQKHAGMTCSCWDDKINYLAPTARNACCVASLLAISHSLAIAAACLSLNGSTELTVVHAIKYR